jgi:hypothetical protein
MNFMSAKVFVDTNVLVYARDDSEPEKQQKAMAWMMHLWTSQAGRLSFQILQEFYSTVTQKLHPGMDLQSARNDVQSLFAWHPTYVGADTIQGAHGRSRTDSNFPGGIPWLYPPLRSLIAVISSQKTSRKTKCLEMFE